jgi:TNF receptor-associated protein 1
MTPSSKPKSTKTRQFKADVRQVLDIVVHSLYTHREIFVRELVSNAADALEKMRHESLVHMDVTDSDAALAITIETDPEAHTITVSDTGVGMTGDELTESLGTIARSGTRSFLEQLSDDAREGTELIGKFGVGFYSSFMVADEVQVTTRSMHPDADGWEWVSDGNGKYSMTQRDDLPRGTSVTVKLREDAHEFEDTKRNREIVETYSTFVPFPITVADEAVNTVQAIWTRQPSELTDDDYSSFFKYLANADDEPVYKLHLTADAPLQLASILYVPPNNLEQFGLMKLKPQVNLYCRKVLVQQHAENLLPGYFRFVTGVVDSADLPLNISRETLQDNAVFRKLGRFLTNRFIKHLTKQATEDAERYADFWNRFGTFIKEGMVADHEHRDDLAELLRFRSSVDGDDSLVSLAEYKGRMREDQTGIYYLNGRSRAEIEAGPYYEAFRARGIEVLYLYDPADDFVLTALREYDGVKLVSADAADIELPGDDEPSDVERTLSEKQVADLTAWIAEVLGDRVKEVRETKRAMNRPAIIVNPDDGLTTSMKKILKASGREPGFGDGGRIMDIDPTHTLITRLGELRDGAADKGFLITIVEQMYDNALIEAGMIDEPGPLVNRMYDIMARALDNADPNA